MQAPKSVGRMTEKAFFAFPDILKRLEGLGAEAGQTEKRRAPSSLENRWKGFEKRRPLPLPKF